MKKGLAILVVLTLLVVMIPAAAQANERHPFAVALEAFIANTAGETHATLVYVDGNRTPGMIVIDVNEVMGTLFYLHEGTLLYKDAGLQDAGLVTGITSAGRAVNLMGDGGDSSYVLFEIVNGRLVETLVIRSMWETEDSRSFGYFEGSSLDAWQALTTLTYAEFNQMRARYGLDNLQPPWWNRQDQTAEILAMTLQVAATPPVSQPPSEITVTLNGAIVAFEGQGPEIVGGRTLVPVRGVFEAMNFTVDWNDAARQATLTRDDTEIVITIDSATFTTNGTSHTLDVPAQIIGGRTLVPLRAVLESVGYALDWNDATRTVIITS